jgi:peptidoglycan-N-acetylglucosamine deacetylase
MPSVFPPVVAPPRARVASVSLALGLALVLVAGLAAHASSVLTHGPRARPWVALTFDDGWAASRCEQIVRTLRAKGAPATFFINGSVMAREPGRWRRMLDGFSVANHTRTHPWLTRLGAAAIRREIAGDEALIERILGRPMLKLMRPPYGAYDRRVVAVADSLGYRTILWDTSSGDTSLSATTSSVIRNGSRGGNGAVVLMHCGPAVTPGAVGPIIDSYRRRGYELVDLARMFGGEPPSPPAPPTACRVTNAETGVTRRSISKAVDGASPGQRLRLQGTCKGDVTIRGDVRIAGSRSGSSGPPTILGTGSRSVVRVRAGASLTLVGLTVRGGHAPDGGGGIRNRGTLVLRDTIIRGNRSEGRGGGLLNGVGGAARLLGSSSVRGNTAAVSGGGILNVSGASLTLDGTSVVSRNQAPAGGGIDNRGTLVMKGASAIRGNAAETGGGAFLDAGGVLEGVVCAPEPGANIRDNTPDDCAVPPLP